MLHELAFAEADALVADLKDTLGEELIVIRASERELPASRAVAAYPFNSQALWVTPDRFVIVAPEDARADAASNAFLEHVTSEVARHGGGARAEVHYLDLRQSMRNGGGPACLRLRVPLTPAESRAIHARVLLDDARADELAKWVATHYRDRLAPADLADPALHRESMAALDALTSLLGLGSIYDFQRDATRHSSVPPQGASSEAGPPNLKTTPINRASVVPVD
jgi:succinylarginine dihydrolase